MFRQSQNNGIARPAPFTHEPHPENEKAKSVRLYHTLEAASDRLALAGDTVGYAMCLRVLNSVTL